MLHHRPVRGHRGGIRVLHKAHGVGIAHVDQREGIAAFPHLHRMADDRATHGGGGNLRAVQLGRAHVHAHAPGAPVRGQRQAEQLDLPAGFHGELGFVRQPPVVAVFGHAADAVSAHAALAAVIVEHAHAKIRNLAGQNQNQPIRPAAEVLPAHPDAQGRRVIHLFLEAVDIEIVVSGALHLGKAHAVTAFPAFPPSIPHAPPFDHQKAPGGR